VPDRTPRKIGLGLVAAGAACNPWLIGRLFLDGGRVATLPAFVFTLTCDLFLVAAGAWFLLRSRLLTPRTAWFSLILWLSIPALLARG